MELDHLGKRPCIHASAYVAPTAVICGDVTIGADTRILFGAVVVAEGGPVEIGAQCIIMEHAVIRGTGRHPTRLGNHILVGPHAHLSGCTVANNVFLATGASVFNGASIGGRATVRINGIVHVKTALPEDAVVPIGWVAIGDPVRILPPTDHDAISAELNSLNFPRTVFGLERAPAGESIMPEITRRYGRGLARHRADRVVEGRRTGG